VIIAVGNTKLGNKLTLFASEKGTLQCQLQLKRRLRSAQQ